MLSSWFRSHHCVIRNRADAFCAPAHAKGSAGIVSRGSSRHRRFRCHIEIARHLNGERRPLSAWSARKLGLLDGDLAGDWPPGGFFFAACLPYPPAALAMTRRHIAGCAVFSLTALRSTLYRQDMPLSRGFVPPCLPTKAKATACGSTADRHTSGLFVMTRNGEPGRS